MNTTNITCAVFEKFHTKVVTFANIALKITIFDLIYCFLLYHVVTVRYIIKVNLNSGQCYSASSANLFQNASPFSK